MDDMYAARRVRRSGRMPAVGSRIQVYYGTAKHTSGGLTKGDLKKNPAGRIVSVKVSAASARKFAANPVLKAHANASPPNRYNLRRK